MTDIIAKIEIADNDDFEFFSRNLYAGLGDSRTQMMMQSEVDAILAKMVNKSFTYASYNLNGIDRKYIFFLDELTYTEFILLV